MRPFCIHDPGMLEKLSGRYAEIGVFLEALHEEIPNCLY